MFDVTALGEILIDFTPAGESARGMSVSNVIRAAPLPMSWPVSPNWAAGRLSSARLGMTPSDITWRQSCRA